MTKRSICKHKWAEVGASLFKGTPISFDYGCANCGKTIWIGASKLRAWKSEQKRKGAIINGE